jgi:hypothetical protein
MPVAKAECDGVWSNGRFAVSNCDKRTFTHSFFEIVVGGEPLRTGVNASRTTHVDPARNWSCYSSALGSGALQRVPRGLIGFIESLARFRQCGPQH